MIRKLLQYWLLASVLTGAVVFIYGWFFLSADCRECPALSFIIGLMTGGASLLANLGFFLLLIPVLSKQSRIISSAVICLLPTLIWKFLFLKNEWIDPPEAFIMPVLITVLLCGCYIFIRTRWNERSKRS